MTRKILITLSEIQFNCSRLRLSVKYNDGSKGGSSADEEINIRDMDKLLYDIYVRGHEKIITSLHDYRQDSSLPIASVGGNGFEYFYLDINNDYRSAIMLVISYRRACPLMCKFCYAQSPSYGSRTRYVTYVNVKSKSNVVPAIRNLLIKLLYSAIRSGRYPTYHLSISFGGSCEPYIVLSDLIGDLYRVTDLGYIIRDMDLPSGYSADLNKYCDYIVEFYDRRGNPIMDIYVYYTISTSMPFELVTRLENSSIYMSKICIGWSFRPKWMRDMGLINITHDFNYIADTFRLLNDLSVKTCLMVLACWRDRMIADDDALDIASGLDYASAWYVESRLTILPLMYKPTISELTQVSPERVYFWFMKPLLEKLSFKYVGGDFASWDICYLSKITRTNLCKRLLESGHLYHFNTFDNRLYIPDICPLGGNCTAL